MGEPGGRSELRSQSISGPVVIIPASWRPSDPEAPLRRPARKVAPAQRARRQSISGQFAPEVGRQLASSRQRVWGARVVFAPAASWPRGERPTGTALTPALLSRAISDRRPAAARDVQWAEYAPLIVFGAGDASLRSRAVQCSAEMAEH